MASEYEKNFGKHWIVTAYDEHGDLAVGIYHSLDRCRSDVESFVRKYGGHCFISRVIDDVREEVLENGK